MHVSQRLVFRFDGTSRRAVFEKWKAVLPSTIPFTVDAGSAGSEGCLTEGCSKTTDSPHPTNEAGP